MEYIGYVFNGKVLWGLGDLRRTPGQSEAVALEPGCVVAWWQHMLACQPRNTQSATYESRLNKQEYSRYKVEGSGQAPGKKLALA